MHLLDADLDPCLSSYSWRLKERESEMAKKETKSDRNREKTIRVR